MFSFITDTGLDEGVQDGVNKVKSVFGDGFNGFGVFDTFAGGDQVIEGDSNFFRSLKTLVYVESFNVEEISLLGGGKEGGIGGFADSFDVFDVVEESDDLFSESNGVSGVNAFFVSFVEIIGGFDGGTDGINACLSNTFFFEPFFNVFKSAVSERVFEIFEDSFTLFDEGIEGAVMSLPGFVFSFEFLNSANQNFDFNEAFSESLGFFLFQRRSVVTFFFDFSDGLGEGEDVFEDFSDVLVVEVVIDLDDFFVEVVESGGASLEGGAVVEESGDGEAAGVEDFGDVIDEVPDTVEGLFGGEGVIFFSSDEGAESAGEVGGVVVALDGVEDFNVFFFFDFDFFGGQEVQFDAEDFFSFGGTFINDLLNGGPSFREVF